LIPLSAWDGVRQTQNDLSRKFNNTWVLARAVSAKSPGKEQTGVCYISAVREETVDGELVENDRPFTVPHENFYIIKAVPDPGVYTLEGGGVVLLRRLPARQWHEGLYNGNFLVYINGERTINWGNSVARQLFKPQEDVSLTEALKVLPEGKCLRLTKTYWLQSRKAERIVNLMRNNTRCGSWAEDQFYWAPAGKIMKEELKDELKFHV
jgi:hypothetical protein